MKEATRIKMWKEDYLRLTDPDLQVIAKKKSEREKRKKEKRDDTGL